MRKTWRGDPALLTMVLLFGVLPLLSGWSLWRDEKADPDAATAEILEQASAIFKKCAQLAIKADEDTIRSGERKQPVLRAWAEQADSKYKSASDMSIDVNRKEIKAKHPEVPGPAPLEVVATPSEYERECALSRLRGCLLPPEEMSKVEEFMYRTRNCPSRDRDCGRRLERIRELQGMRPALQKSKNVACGLGEYDEPKCVYDFRRLEAVIEAISVNDILYERACFE